MAVNVLDVIPRFGFRVRVAASSEQGLRREVLQDMYLAAPELGVFAIADGMGGHQAGEVAAKEALAEVRRAMSSDTTNKIAKRYIEQPILESRRRVLERLKRVVERAHARVRELALQGDHYKQIGTTLDIAWLLREEVFLAHVGDSRAYIVRPNTTLQITEDHSAPIGTQFAAEEPQTARCGIAGLVRAVGFGESVSVDTLMTEVRRGDRVVLVTDGVWAAFDDEAELGHIARHADTARAAAGLVSQAAQRSFDDRTALVIELGERFVRHSTNDSDAVARDVGPVVESALFSGMSWPRILSALSVAVHVEFECAQPIVHRVAGDRVAYIVLDGLIKLADGRRLGRGATLFAECLVGCDPIAQPPICEETVRAIRIRRDDFQEICASDPNLAADLYRRLAEHLGRRLAR